MDEAQRWLEAISVVPEALLRRAMEATAGDERAHYARLGLELEPLSEETSSSCFASCTGRSSS